ncbi:MAG: hypothetical protein A3K10_16575 [Bacteroidetes bacterium RIFCSPLOWO2_12_FULL_31_6]|nr:MAG: hypothetical protein A3K10_16575 [Bacteroidetes bacterium RIFCSPLOWO2_12_FULL_31_6]
MELYKFLETIKEEKNVDSKNQQTKMITVSSVIHLKIKQTSFLYNIPISNLVDGILNQWITENKDAIIADRIKSIKTDF